MIHTQHQLDDGLYHRFITKCGTIWVRIADEGKGVGSVSVYEQESAVAALELEDYEARELPVTLAARNKFGTGRMLRIFRAVKAAMPEITTWITDNREKSGTFAGRKHERVR